MNDTIRQSIVNLAEKSPYISYVVLHTALGTKNDSELETLLVEAIYERTIEGKLNPSQRIVEVSDWRASIPDQTQCAFIVDMLQQWIGHCEGLISDLNSTAAGSNERATQTKEEDAQHEKDVEENAHTYGKFYAADLDGGRMYNYNTGNRDKSRRIKNPFTAGPSRRNR